VKGADTITCAYTNTNLSSQVLFITSTTTREPLKTADHHDVVTTPEISNQNLYAKNIIPRLQQISDDEQKGGYGKVNLTSRTNVTTFDQRRRFKSFL
jgi:hypothetical protein